MKTFIQILKSAIKAILKWLVLTIIALTIDSLFHLSDKSEIFTFLFITVPLVAAVWEPSKQLIHLAVEYEKSKPPKPPKSQKPKPIAKPSPAPKPAPVIKSSPPLKPDAQSIGRTIARIDRMEGHEFERFCADILRRNGYQRVEVTRGSGDQGVDIIAVKDGKKYAIQCKRYNQKLGNKPVQEVHAGKTIYGCNVAVVMTNNYFTEGGKEAARALGVELWDRDVLSAMLRASARREGTQIS